MSRLSRLFGHFRYAKPAQADRAEVPAAALGWIIAGLGNPGAQYACSRHNAGFMTIELLAESNHAKLGRRRFGAITAEAELAGARTLLVQPQTFYNDSGPCLRDLLGYFKVPPHRLIVIHDDLDLEPGRIRLKSGGGDAGNRGVRSIARALGSEEFIRVRIGIGRPANEEEARDYVLKAMSASELGTLALERAAAAVAAIAAEGLERAMGRFNQRS
jgi:peptidyl-tRNA hydrolase, PTH1 family